MSQSRKTISSSVHRTLNIIGDRWSQMIIEQTFRGAARFEEFRARTGASRNTLTSRLAALVENGVLEKRAHRDGAAHLAYVLTPRGRDLYDAVLLMWSWGIRWDAVSPTGPTALVHSTCGKRMLPLAVCRHCRSDISLHSCSHRPGPGAGFDTMDVARLHRRRQVGEASDRGPPDVMDMVGDRWTGLVVSMQYFGVHRFDDIQKTLEIGTSILADRLRALVHAGVLERRLYQISPPRYEYWLTHKGRDLYPHALTLLLWGDTWLADDSGPPLIVTHKQCGKPVKADVVCSACRERLTPESVVERPARSQAPAR